MERVSPTLNIAARRKKEIPEKQRAYSEGKSSIEAETAHLLLRFSLGHGSWLCVLV
jgi:hypothetical protein